MVEGFLKNHRCSNKYEIEKWVKHIILILNLKIISMKIILFIILIISVFNVSVFSKIMLPSVLSNNMNLLQNSKIQKNVSPPPKVIQVNFNKKLTKVNGFGVNITPAQWNDGKLKPAIDRLTDDLGATLFRFDCVGLANWLDPARRRADGLWSDSYLDSVYHSKVFSDSWQTFRYLNKKGIEPFFNVSGSIHPGLGKQGREWNTLSDFDGYAEMVATMLEWARQKEGLKFSLLAPFNETDLAYPEGPKIDGKYMLTATQAIIKKLDNHGLTDIKLIAIDDAVPSLNKLEAVLSDSTLAGRIYAFGTHTYGDADICDGNGNDFVLFSKAIRNSAFRNSSVWLTEYGDLDQTGEIEFEFAWRSTRRLMKRLDDGFNAALAWDAFDNFHKHDTVWATYGLLKTDTVNWTYIPKKRFYAAKQVYKFVKPGWKMVEISIPQTTKFDIYKTWHDSFRSIRIQAFVSPDGNDYSLVIMNDIESDLDLLIKLNNISDVALSKNVKLFVTDKKNNCSMGEKPLVKDHTIRVLLPEHSISTITTLK